MSEKVYAVIMAGGRGERFWPLSTQSRPKQLLDLFGGHTLLAMAVERLTGFVPPERILIVTRADLVAACASACPGVPAANIVGEPVGRDTAAACVLGTAWVAARDPAAACMILTSDQLIAPAARFVAVLRACVAVARERQCIATIGIKPTYACTGFGYIEAGAPPVMRNGVSVRPVARFVEKPDAATAQAYLESGAFYWNSGMFVWTADGFAAALQTHAPDLLAAYERLRGGAADSPRFGAAVSAVYASVRRISIDFALMERVSGIWMAECDFEWDDVGSWPALARHVPCDTAGNAVVGRAVAVEAAGNIVVSPDRLTALFGVRDLVVVHAPGATLVCARERAQDIKELLQRLQAGGQADGLL